MRKLKVEESISLEDGRHEGRIEDVEERIEPFEYTDVYIREKRTGFKLKYGCPSKITPKTKLGRLLQQWITLRPGNEIDPGEVLKGREVSFMTISKNHEGKDYTEIIDDSVKPIIQSILERVI